MFTYTLRRLLTAIPTVLLISLVIFMLLELAPGDPMSDVPMTVPPEVKAQMRAALGLDQPGWVRYLLWLKQFFWVEPLQLVDHYFGTAYGADMQRVISWQTRSPVTELIIQRLPQTLWVVGMGYVVGVALAVPIGVISAYRQYSWFDQIGTFISMVGFSVPTFFTGVLLIVIFSVQLNWFPSIYDTTLVVNSWSTFWQQVQQMVMPVAVLALYNAAQISRYMRASMLDNLQQDYVRTARAKGMREKVVVLVHVLRNSMIPVVTVIALGVPSIFAGAIITEQALSFLGLGFPPDFPTWGRLLFDAVDQLQLYPNRVMLPGIAISLTVLSVNYIGDGLRDALDPRIRGR